MKGRYILIQLVILIFLSLMTFGFAAESPIGKSIIEDFENISDWTFQDGSQTGVVVEQVTSPVHDGTYSLRFRPTTTGGSFSAYGHSDANKVRLEDAMEFNVWIYGDNSGVEVKWRLKDNYGEIFQSPSFFVNWTGWQQISWSPSNSNDHWCLPEGCSGGTTGVIDYPIGFDSFVVFKKSPQPTLYFDQLVAIGTFKFGLQDHGPAGTGGPYQAVSIEAQLDDVEKSNVSYVRMDFTNGAVGSGDWSQLDAMVNTAIADGLRILAVCQGYKNERQASYDKAYTVASRYGSKINYYQLDNELDGYAIDCSIGSDCSDGQNCPNGMDKAHYCTLRINEVVEELKGLYDGVKAGNPIARTVINIGFLHYGFLDWCKDSGVKWDISGLDWYSDMEQYCSPHYTCSPDGLGVNGLKYMLSKLYTNYKKNVWVCENNLKDNDPNWTETKQARFIELQAGVATQEIGTTAYFVYELYSSGGENYGLINDAEVLTKWEGYGSYSVVKTPVTVGTYSAKLIYDFATSPYYNHVTYGNGTVWSEKIIENFEDISDWTFQDGSQIGVVVEQVTSPVHSGTYSLKFQSTTTVGSYSAYGHSDANKVWLNDTTQFSVWVYGDNSGRGIQWRLRDYYGEMFQSPGVIVNWTGWKQVIWTPSGSNEHWGGSGGTAGVIDYPIGFDSFVVFNNGSGDPQPPLYFDQLVACSNQFKVQLYGDNSNHQIKIRFVDTYGEIFQKVLTNLNFSGWSLKSVDINETGAEYWGGTGGTTGIIDHPIKFNSIVIEDNSAVDIGQVYVDEILADGSKVLDFEYTRRQAYNRYAVTTQPENFEDISDWTFQDGSQTGVVVQQVTSPVHTGTYSLKFMPTTVIGGYSAYGHRDLDKVWMNDTTQFSVWVYGDNSGRGIQWRLKDAYGETFQSSGFIVNWTGWQKITWVPSGSNEHWGGSGGTAGVIDYPIGFDSLIMYNNGNGNPQPPIYFDELTAK